ncbi:MAG: DUF6051 family protein [Bacteroidales bacterium]|jgi:hypothetical protein|nr:DUF6051 family protein [Bacteroidales bacterium]
MKDLTERIKILGNQFSLHNKVELQESGEMMLPFKFRQKYEEREVEHFQKCAPAMDFFHRKDDILKVNKRFRYPVFAPKNARNCHEGILMLHGLNERMWNKYLPWAEYICHETGKPVILFPIAFHMNRSPECWFNPRDMMPYVENRRSKLNAPNCSFANVALSTRLTQSPLRFYVSGRESFFNIVQLLEQIKDGDHPLFAKDASMNVFAYSIGALLAQVLMLANPDRLFTETRFFFFCGGSIFEKMNGSSKEIMDSEAFKRLYEFYTADFNFKNDYIEEAFKSMVLTETNQESRELFFSREAGSGKVKAITLAKDTVMPTYGAEEAFGPDAGKEIITEMDFPFNYTHQTPFPTNRKIDTNLLDDCFRSVFDKACEQLI